MTGDFFRCAPSPRRRAGARWLAACLALLALSAAATPPAARKQTVCTITVNSADEKETFHRYLPASKYSFVELVERNRPDWLGSACRASIACDVLVISGHFDGDNAFFSDRLDVDEHLTVAELERVSCSDSCPALFSRLKEVYLFGCNTLNPEPLGTASTEIVRNLVREGVSRKEAERQLNSLRGGHGDSSRDRMRQIFKDVPAIYGFSSTAPPGPTAASVLNRYFNATGAREIATGRADVRLLGHFAPFSMSVARGVSDGDRESGARRDMCHFTDERQSAAARLAFIHRVLQRHVGEARLYLDRMLRFMAVLDEPTRQLPEVRQTLDAIARDTASRTSFLDFTRNVEQPPVRVRMISLAHELGWLAADARTKELALMLRDLQSRGTPGVADVNLACALNQGRTLDGAFDTADAARAADDVARAAVRACLGSEPDRARVLQALHGPREADIQMARTYLRHRPIDDVAELRRVTAEIATMRAPDAQARAVETLSRQYVSDPQTVELLLRLFGLTLSSSVQAAVAAVLIRADRKSISSPHVLDVLRSRRLPPRAGEDIVDALIRRLESR